MLEGNFDFDNTDTASLFYLGCVIFSVLCLFISIFVWLESIKYYYLLFESKMANKKIKVCCMWENISKFFYGFTMLNAGLHALTLVSQVKHITSEYNEKFDVNPDILYTIWISISFCILSTVVCFVIWKNMYNAFKKMELNSIEQRKTILKCLSYQIFDYIM